MATRIQTAPGVMRKQPRQARSRATIELILEVAAHILAQRGWHGFTTNAVADKAGISIGSLYQYFPNKLALIEAVRRRHYDEVLAVLDTASDGRLARRQRLAAYVDGMIAVHSRHPAAHQVLLQDAPLDTAAIAAHREFETGYRRGCIAVLQANAGGAIDEPAIPAQVLAAAVAGIIHDAAGHGILASPQLRQELLTVVESYLSRRRPLAPGHQAT